MNRRAILVLCALGLVLAPGAWAEVGMPFGDPQTGSRTHGPLVSVIGDAPDPFPDVWNPVTFPGSGSVPLNPGGSENGDGEPSIAHNPATGEWLVAWARSSLSGYDVVVSRFLDGAWSEPVVAAGGLGDEADPWLAISEAGDIHVVYVSTDPVRSIRLTVAPPDLSIWSAPEQVSDPAVHSTSPSAVFHDGELRVVYESHDLGYGATPKSLVMSRLEGGRFVREVVAVTSHPGSSQPRVGSHDGKAWLDWIDATFATGSGELAWIRLGEPGPTNFVPYVDAFDREFHVRPGVRLRVVAP